MLKDKTPVSDQKKHVTKHGGDDCLLIGTKGRVLEAI